MPVPPALLNALDMVHGVRELQASRGKGRGERLWPCSRMTGWRAVHAVMMTAKLDEPQASCQLCEAVLPGAQNACFWREPWPD